MTSKTGWLTQHKIYGTVASMLATVFATAFSGHAQTQTQPYYSGTAAGKSGYNLFNMTPENLRRPFSTDHGLTTPYTIDAGAFAAGFYGSYAYRDRSPMGFDQSSEWWSGGAMLKVGIFNDFDLEATLPSYTAARTTYKSTAGLGTNFGSSTYKAHGWTDFWLTGKYNILGNDHGPASWAVLGTVKFPTACSSIENPDYYEGGLASIFAYQFQCGWQVRFFNGFLVADREFFNSDDEEEDCWDADFEDSVCIFSPMLLTNLQAYSGFDTDVTTSGHDNWDGYFTLGATYNLSPNFQLFAQSDFGVNGLVADYMPSLGFDFRY